MDFSHELRFVPALIENLEDIFTIFRAAVEKMEHDGIHQWDEIYPDRQTLQNDILKNQMFISKLDGETVCAYVINRECDGEYSSGNWNYPDETALIVHRLCVNPKYQHKGIAHQAMLYIEAQAGKMGARSIRLDCFTLNPFALRLYSNLGYHKTGVVTWRKGDFYLMEKSI